MATDLALIRRIRAITEREPRPYEAPYQELVAALERAEAEAAAGVAPAWFDAAWDALVAELVTTPEFVPVFFPRHVQAVPTLPDLLRSLARLDPDEEVQAALAQTRREWIAEQGAVEQEDSLLAVLLEELEHGDFRSGGYPLIGRYFRFRDALFAHLVNPAWGPLHREVFGLLALQHGNWTKGYVADYAYQGYARLGISGVKPTEHRLASWELDDVLLPGMRVLDIGSNNGFLALEIARTVGHVTAIEYNPYLVLVSTASQAWLGADNVRFLCGDYTSYPLEGGYDVILSLANHQTTDQRMTMPFRDYVARAYSLLRPGGFFLFESHNVFGPGTGGPGDDGDLDAKFDQAERYFEVLRHKMTRAFVPGNHDVDKLFVVMRRRDAVDEGAKRTLDLASARVKYEYRTAASAGSRG